MISRIALAAVLFSMCACAKGQIIDTQPITSTGGANIVPQVTITASQVFVIPDQPSSWRFYGANGCQMTIGIWKPAVTDAIPPNSVVFSADKNADSCYWNPGTPQAHLDGVMTTEPDGSFSYIKFLMTFPQSCQFCVGGWKYLDVDVLPSGDGKIPYLIVPASVTTGVTDVVDTEYYGYGVTGTDPSTLTWNSVVWPGTPPPAVHWRTVSTVDNVSTPSYTGPAMSVEVFEGPCFRADGSYFADVSCNHEKMFWAPQWGFVKNMVFSIGSGELLNPDGSHNPVYDMYR